MFSFSFISCSRDDNDNELSSVFIGTWDVVKTTYYYEFDGLDSDTEDGNGAYWIFSNNKLTLHDSKDLMNGKSLDYTYNSDSRELKVSGFPLYKVIELTSSTLVMRAELVGGYQITNLKKR